MADIYSGPEGFAEPEADGVSSMETSAFLREAYWTPPARRCSALRFCLWLPFAFALVLLRLALGLVLVLLLMILCVVVMCCGCTEGCRRPLRSLSRPMNRLILLVLGVGWIKVVKMPGYDANSARKLAPTVVANHVSWLDIIVLDCVIGNITAVMNKYYSNIPGLNLVVRAWGIVTIENKQVQTEKTSDGDDRRRPQRATDQIISYQTTRKSDPSSGPRLCIFPEGTVRLRLRCFTYQ
eukprot:SAG31_NODE_145_length_22612_cov_5.938169_15_plen_238_part_00